MTIVAPGSAAAIREVPRCSGIRLAPASSGNFEAPAVGDTRSIFLPPDRIARITRNDSSDRESPRVAVLSPPFFVEPAELPLVLGLAVLGLLAVSLVGILVEVIRQLRSSHV